MKPPRELRLNSIDQFRKRSPEACTVSFRMAYSVRHEQELMRGCGCPNIGLRICAAKIANDP